MAKLTQATVIRATLDGQPNKVFTVPELHSAIKAAGINDVFEVQVLGYVRVMASRGQALRGPELNTFTSTQYRGAATVKGPKKQQATPTSQNAPHTTQEAPRATKRAKATTDTPPATVIEEPKAAAKRIKAKRGSEAEVVITKETAYQSFKAITQATPEEKDAIGGTAIPKKRLKSGTMDQQQFVILIQERFGTAPGAKSETNYAHCFQFSQVDCTTYSLDYLDTRCQAISNGKRPIWWVGIVNEVVNVGIYAQEKA